MKNAPITLPTEPADVLAERARLLQAAPITFPTNLADALERANTILSTIESARKAIREAEMDLAEAMAAEQRATNVLSAAEADAALGNGRQGALKVANGAHEKAVAETDRLERLVKGLRLRLEQMQAELPELVATIRPALASAGSALFEEAMAELEAAIAAPLSRAQAMAALVPNGNGAFTLASRIAMACGLANKHSSLPVSLATHAHESVSKMKEVPEWAAIREPFHTAAATLSRLEILVAHPVKVEPTPEPRRSDNYLGGNPAYTG